MVRLKVDNTVSLIVCETMFQFHNGSIKSAKFNSKTALLARFQFHNGSIKSMQAFGPKQRKISFNSTMVRLKGDDPGDHASCAEGFNSTMVRLKGYLSYSPNLISMKFQFHNGSIKSQLIPESLNPTLKFQFHNGSIKSCALYLQ